MKKSHLLSLLVLAGVLGLAVSPAFSGNRNVLTIANHTGADISIDRVTCDGQTFGFPSGTLTNNMGTSQASDLLQSGSQIVINGTFKVVNPAPNGRTTGVINCTLPLTQGMTCSSGVRTGKVTKTPLPDFDAWYITFE